MVTNSILADPSRLLKPLSIVVLAFIPINMVMSPILDFFWIAESKVSWTVSVSAYIFILTVLPLLLVTIFFMKTKSEKIFLSCAIVFFIYAFAFTIYKLTDIAYPIFGMVSALGSTLVTILLYVSVRDHLLTDRAVFYSLAATTGLVLVPLLLVQMYPHLFAQLAKELGAKLSLYGYENPRALGWPAAAGVALSSGYLITLPKESRIPPALFLLVIICSTCLFWTGSRGGVASSAVGIIVVFLFSRTRNYKNAIFILVCIAVGAFISNIIYLPSSEYDFFSRIAYNPERADLNNLSSGRLDLWRITFGYILERPFTGYGYLPDSSLEDFQHRSAHNFFFDLWLWFGLVVGSLIILAGIGLWIIALSFFRNTNNQYVSSYFCVMTTFYAYSLVSVLHTRTVPLLIFALVCGALLGRRAQKMSYRPGVRKPE